MAPAPTAQKPQDWDGRLPSLCLLTCNVLLFVDIVAVCCCFAIFDASLLVDVFPFVDVEIIYCNLSFVGS